MTIEGTLLAKSQVDRLVSNGSVSYDANTYPLDYNTGDLISWPHMGTFYDHYHYYYPYVTPMVVTPNRKEQALAVAKILVDKKLARVTTIKQFIDLVDVLVNVL